MKIHHIGYAVKNIEKSISEFERLGYVLYSEKFIDKEKDVSIQFVKNGELLVELIAPLSENSPVNNIIKKYGSMPYHICYEIEEIEKKIQELKKQQFVLVKKPQTAIAINNRKVAFLFSKAIGLIELIEI